MKDCKDCEFKGYSPQLCLLHTKHCRNKGGHEPKPVSRPVKVGVKTLVGVGLGTAAVLLGSAAVSLVGGAAIMHALFLKLSAGAGLAGGGIGLITGIAENKEKDKDR